MLSYRWLHNGRYAKLVQMEIINGEPTHHFNIKPDEFRIAYAEASRKTHVKIEKNGVYRLLSRAVKLYRCITCGSFMMEKEARKGAKCIGCSTMNDQRMGSAKQLDKPFSRFKQELPNE